LNGHQDRGALEGHSTTGQLVRTLAVDPLGGIGGRLLVYLASQAKAGSAQLFGAEGRRACRAERLAGEVVRRGVAPQAHRGAI